jgi:hypothetical protein
MRSTTVKRVVLAILLVTTISMMVPAHARAATLNQSSAPGMGLWQKAVNWLHHVIAGVVPPSAPGVGHTSKFGAAHTSDGHCAAALVQAY